MLVKKIVYELYQRLLLLFKYICMLHFPSASVEDSKNVKLGYTKN